ncbi:MAG: hypothetical protein JKX93_02115 [Rhizobiaceae bacterium]|nr:hypothetical protein [Rhizobiaceae bacterium]
MNENISDEILTAFLDQELSETERARVETALAADMTLADRLHALEIDTSAFVKSYDALKQFAPAEKLETPQTQSNTSYIPNGRKGLIAASVVLALGLGVSLGLVLGETGFSHTNSQVQQQTASNEEWRQAVAEYQALYTSNTLNRVNLPVNEQKENLAALSKDIDLEITIEKLLLNELEFKRGQVLNYKGKKLVQLAYLYENSKPVAFCILNESQGEFEISPEQRKNLKIVHWTKNGRSFMIIGDVPKLKLKSMATKLNMRF